MSKQEIITYVAAILATALDTEPTPFPESTAYMAMGMDMSKWETIRSILLGGDMVSIRGNAIALTQHGRELAEKCNAASAA